MAKHQPPTKTAVTLEALEADAERLRALADRSFDPDADPATLTGRQVFNRLVAVCDENQRLVNLLDLRIAERNTVRLQAALEAEDED